MIPCPSCGTRNRRGSKYCYRCGQRLDIVFDVSCPACDRLNPGGSAFCAFCGAQIPGPPPAEGLAPAEQPAVAEQPAPMLQEPLASQPESVEPVAEPARELPSWLYAAPSPGESKYLSDIPGVLPRTEGWLSSIPKPAADVAPQPETKAQRGCLTLVLPALLVAVGVGR